MKAMIFLYTLFLGLTVTCYGVDKIKWTGCGITKKAFMVEAAKAYKAKTGNIISLSGGGATKGIRAANAGKADIGGNCRCSLADKFPKEEGNAYVTVVAWDALVPIVNKANPVSNITTQQLKDVLTGKITNWKDLGGPDKKIVLCVRKGKISGVGYMARKTLFNDPNLDFAKSALKLKSSGVIENKVKTDPQAFAITGISSAKKRVNAGEKIKILKLDGLEPTVNNIKAGKLSTFRPLYLSTKGKPQGKTKLFIDWLLTDEGQTVIESCGTVSLRQGKGLKQKFKYWENVDHIVNYDKVP